MSPLTVGTSVDFYAQTNPSFLAPLQRDKPQEASHNSLLQLMANHALRIGVPREGLQTQKCARAHTHAMKLNTSKPQARSQTSSFGA